MTNNPLTTRFGLLRHGETEWNREKRIQGHSDSPLTADGLTAALKWGDLMKSLPVTRLLTSDLGRARQTASAVNRSLNLPISEDSRLREQNWGQWEGWLFSKVRHDDRFTSQQTAGWNFRPIDGETRQEVWHRSHNALIDAARTWPGHTVLVVTHEGVIRCLLNRLLGRKFVPEEPPVIRARHLHWLVYRSGNLEMERFNAIDLNAGHGTLK